MFLGGGIKFIFLTSLLFFIWPAYAFDDVINHPLLARKSVELFNASLENKISSQEINWIMQGAQEEDTPLRWMNHFYNPQTGAGLFLYSSAKDWAGQNIRQSLYPKGNQAWQKALDFYVKGDKKEAFIALGHNLHLIEDMAVPAHTRNDIHPTGDPFENWAKNNADGKFAKISTTKFNNLEEYFDSLANYSNKYFLSKDTVGGIYLSEGNTFKKKINGITVNCVRGSIGSSEFCLIVYVKSNIGTIKYFIDDSVVHSDYYSLLAPKAISYGAGMIDLFFKEAEKKKAEEAQKSLLDKLKSVLSSFLKGAEPIEQNIKSAFEANKQALENLSESLKIVNDQGGKVLSASISADDLFKPEPVKAQDKSNNSISVLSPIAPPIFENEKKGSEAVENVFMEEEIIPLAENSQPSSIFNHPNFFIIPGGDATRPETTITGKPEKISSSSLAGFVFSSSKTNSSFEYNLNNAGWREAFSPVNLTGLNDGQYSIEIRAFDSYRNFDESSAVYNWIVDMVAPTSTVNDLAENYSTAIFTVEWESGDADVSKYNVQYKIEGGDWQEWLTATTSQQAIFDISAEEGKDIFFRAQAFDEAGNLGGWSSEKKTKIIFPLSGHLVISEFVSRGPGGAWDEFVELYNPTGEAINLEDWKLQKKSAGGGAWENFTGASGLPAGAIVSSSSYYLLSAKDYSLSRLPDYRHSVNWGLADGGGHIRIINNLGEEVDKIGYGDAMDSEGEAFIANLSDGSSLERKAVYNSSAVSMAGGSDQWQGNGYDQNNNSHDFILRNTPQPQNSFSPSEPRASDPNIPDDIGSLSVVSASSTPSTIKLSWASPRNANLNSGAYYDLRYKIKSGDCDLQIDWDSASKIATSSLPVPAVSAEETQEYGVSGLTADTEYCFALMVYNGEYWSNLSNQINGETLVAPPVDIAIGHTSSLVSDFGTSTLSWLHTVEAGDEMLFVSAYWSDSNKNIVSVKFAGVALTKIISWSLNGAKTNNSTWYLVNPPAGAYRVEVKFSAKMRIAAAAINLSNIDIANPISASSTWNAQVTHISDTISVANSNSLIIDSASVASGIGTLTADPGQTETFNYRFSYFDGTQVGLSYKEAETAGNYTTGWMQSSNFYWTHTLTVINPKP